MPFHVDRDRFDSLVARAVAGVPPRFRLRLRNVVIVVEDLPSSEDVEATGIPADEMLGIFRGVPLEGQSGFFDMPPVLPDEIALFQRNLEAMVETEDDLIREIRETIVHEVGHYFGLSDEEMP